MASTIPSLLVAYEGDTGLMGFTSTSQGFFMLGSGPNLNNVSAGGSETDAQTPYPAGTISNIWCRVKTAAIQEVSENSGVNKSQGIDIISKHFRHIKIRSHYGGDTLLYEPDSERIEKLKNSLKKQYPEYCERLQKIDESFYSK